MRTTLVIAVISFGSAVHAGQQPQHAMPPGMTHEQHQREMLSRRGADAMGFDQQTTAHHFVLAPDGGAIEVRTREPGDAAGREQVRRHLREIATEFARGDFGKPLATHAEIPPGVRTMQTRTRAITYAFEELPSGGRVRITSGDATALHAIHEFLQYQIREHGTGDPTIVGR